MREMKTINVSYTIIYEGVRLKLKRFNNYLKSYICNFFETISFLIRRDMLLKGFQP